MLDALSNWSPQWAEYERMRVERALQTNRPETIDDLSTIGALWNAHMARSRNTRPGRANAAFATIADGQSDEDKPKTSKKPRKPQSNCPWGYERHPFKPAECSAIHLAVNGHDPFNNRVSEARLNKAKEVLAQGKHKSLIEKVKKSKASKGDDEEEWPPICKLVIFQEDSENAETAFATARPHPLSKSAIYDNCATAHIVNDKNFLEPGTFKSSQGQDVVLVGDSSVSIVGWGRSILKNFFNGPRGRCTVDFPLERVAYVPNFHTNIISAGILKKDGYWVHGLDNTIMWKQNPKVLRQLEEKYGLVVAEYKPISSYPFRRQLPPWSE